MDRSRSIFGIIIAILVILLLAAAVIGSVMGAAIAAALVCLQEGNTTERLQVAVENAVGIAIHGVRSVSTSA